MKPKIIGAIIIALGIVMIANTGLKYVTTEKVVDLGTIKIDKEKNHSVQWSPFIGILMIAGGVLIIARYKRNIGGI